MKIYNLNEKKHLPYKKSRQRKKSSENQIPLFQGRVIKLSDKSFFEEALDLDFANDPSAYDYYLKAIEEKDNIDEAYNNLAILEVEHDKIKAFGYFLKALRYNPAQCEVHFNVANLYFEEKDFPLAKLHYEIAAELDPAFANIYYNLALVQIELNDAEGATESLNKFISLVGMPEAAEAEEIINQIMMYKG